MTVTKVGGANMIAHAQWPQCPPFPRFAIFYVTPDPLKITKLPIQSLSTCQRAGEPMMAHLKWHFDPLSIPSTKNKTSVFDPPLTKVSGSAHRPID